MAKQVDTSLEEALSATVYDWLVSNFPDVAESIENAVAAGVTPKEIKTAVLRYTGQAELAMRCEQVAQWLVRE